MQQATTINVVQQISAGRPSLDGTSSSSSSSSASYGSTTTTTAGRSGIGRLAAENPVLVVGRRGCCMIHVVRRLLQGLGVNPAVCEVGDDAEEAAVAEELLAEMVPSQQQMVFPAVFIGGRLVGGIDRLMAVHISGDLVPILKEAGALWL